MGDMMKLNVIMDWLLDICKIVALMLGIQCQVLLNKMGLEREEIVCFLIWCDVY